MDFDFQTLKRSDRYKLMISTIVPRPIGLVTTVSADGIVNAAPFSFFNGMSSDPPIVVMGLEVLPVIAPRKDTGDNIRDTGEFVVNLVSEDIAEQMNLCSMSAPPEVDELKLAGFTALPSTDVAPPRIGESPVAYECKRMTSMEVGHGNRIVVGEVVHMHIEDRFIDTDKLYVDTPALKLIGRMHGSGWYTRTSDLFEMPRPDYEAWIKENKPAKDNKPGGAS